MKLSVVPLPVFVTVATWASAGPPAVIGANAYSVSVVPFGAARVTVMRLEAGTYPTVLPSLSQPLPDAETTPK